MYSVHPTPLLHIPALLCHFWSAPGLCPGPPSFHHLPPSPWWYFSINPTFMSTDAHWKPSSTFPANQTPYSHPPPSTTLYLELNPGSLQQVSPIWHRVRVRLNPSVQILTQNSSLSLITLLVTIYCFFLFVCLFLSDILYGLYLLYCLCKVSLSVFKGVYKQNELLLLLLVIVAVVITAVVVVFLNVNILKLGWCQYKKHIPSLCT